MRYIVTVEKDGQSQQVTFRDLTAGWIGWQDSSAPSILGTSKMVTIGDEVDHDIKYVDNEGMNKDERACLLYTSQELPDIQLTLLIGQYAQAYYLQEKISGKVTERVKHYQNYLPTYFPLVHPSPRNQIWMAKNPVSYTHLVTV